MSDNGEHRKIAIICSKGSLDMALPGLVIANAARMSGIPAMLFFTFWGLNIVNKKKMEDLHVSFVGNPSVPIPTMIAGLPGMEHMATQWMKKSMKELDVPDVPEFLQMLDDAGAELYGCQMSMDMFKVHKDDLVPQVKEVLTAMDFLEKARGAQIIFI